MSVPSLKKTGRNRFAQIISFESASHIMFEPIRRRTIPKLKEVYKMADIDHLLDVDDLVFDNTETIHSDR